MAGVDKYNGKQTVVLGGYVLNRYHQGNLNYQDSDKIYNSEGLDTRLLYQENQYICHYSYSLYSKLWLDPKIPLGHHIYTTILAELYF